MYWNVLKRVFRQKKYVLAVIVVAFTVVSAALLLPQYSIITQILTSTTLSLGSKFSFVFSLYGSLASNFTILSATYLLVVSVLFGINISLLMYYIKKRQVGSSSAKFQLSSAGGFLSAVLGIGCAACGSIILTAVLGIFGAGALIAFLPFHGLEFGILGLILLILSTGYLLKRINDPLICPDN